MINNLKELRNMSDIPFLSLFTWLNLGIIINTTTGPDVSIKAETDLTKGLVKVRHLQYFLVNEFILRFSTKTRCLF